MKKIGLVIALVLLFSTFAFASTITFVMNNGTHYTWAKKVSKAFEKANPNIHVNIVKIGGLPPQYATKLALTLRTSKKVDVVMMDSFLLSNFSSANLLASIPFNKYPGYKHFYNAFKSMTKIKGKYYGILLGTGSRGLLYNKRILKAVGVKLPWAPKNWAQIISVSKKIKAKFPNVFPFYMTSVQRSEGTSMQTFEMLLYGTPNRLVENGKWVVQSQGFLNSLKFINTIYRNHLGIRPGLIVNPNSELFMESELGPQQKAAIILTGNWIPADWLNHYPKTAKEYGLAAMPTEYGQSPHYITLSGGWMAAINKKATNKKLAQKFLKFITNEQGILEYSQICGNLSPRSDSAANPAYPKALKPASALLQYTAFRPSNVLYPRVSIHIASAVEAVALGKLTPLKAMEQYKKAVLAIVGKQHAISLKYTK